MDLLHDGPSDSPHTLVLAHGAGAGMDHAFMAAFAEGVGAAGVHVVRFEFSYMAAARAAGKRRGPDRMPKLQARFREVLAQLGGRVVLGGKSMGGRVACHLAGEPQARGVLVLGYPFHPPGKPEKLRLEPLQAPPVDVLIIQGERDPFGTREEVVGYPIGPSVGVSFLPGGDHSLKPRKRSGHTFEDNLARAVELAVSFIRVRPE